MAIDVLRAQTRQRGRSKDARMVVLDSWWGPYRKLWSSRTRDPCELDESVTPTEGRKWS